MKTTVTKDLFGRTAWHTVEIMAPPGYTIGVIHDVAGLLQIGVARAGDPPPRKTNPGATETIRNPGEGFVVCAEENAADWREIAFKGAELFDNLVAQAAPGSKTVAAPIGALVMLTAVLRQIGHGLVPPPALDPAALETPADPAPTHEAP